MIKELRTKKEGLFALYNKATSAFWLSLANKHKGYNPEVLKLLSEFRKIIEILTKFMLEDRFNPSVPKAKVQKDELSLKEKAAKQHSVAFLFFKGILPVTKVSKEQPNLKDILTLFKAMEVFIMRRVWIVDLENLKLGQFSDTARQIWDTLPKLLLVISGLTSVEKKLALNFLFSLVVIYRQFKMKSTPDTSTITNPYTGHPIGSLLKSEFSDIKIGEWLRTLGVKLEDAGYLRLSIYSGNASSPNSGASATKIIEDAAAIKLDTNLQTAILGIARNMPKSDNFIYLVKVLFENIWDLNDTKHSRLFHFTAKGGKARIIANVDWLTQTALSGLHFYLYRVLTRISSDFTFDHKKGITYLWDNRQKGDNFYSIDLSAATDRMPRLIQAQILKNLVNELGLNGEEVSKHWLGIMDRTYSTAGSALNNGNPVTYAVGQGMGIFTSWPIMALTHHYIVNKICGISTDNYSLVGDDLGIRGTRADYEKYCGIINALGMSVNINKTIESESGNEENHCIEFARNFIIEGEKITPIEYGILFAWNEQKTSFESFLYAMRYVITSDIVRELASSLYMHFNVISLLNIAYFFFKYKIEIDISSIAPEVLIPKWFKSIDFARVHEAITMKQERIQPGENLLDESREEARFMNNFKSNLVVRTKLDATRARDLAERVSYLVFIDDKIGYMALQISKRLFEVELIRYDVDDFGNPLVSRKARALLKEIAESFRDEYNDHESDLES